MGLPKVNPMGNPKVTQDNQEPSKTVASAEEELQPDLMGTSAARIGPQSVFITWRQRGCHF